MIGLDFLFCLCIFEVGWDGDVGDCKVVFGFEVGVDCLVECCFFLEIMYVMKGEWGYDGVGCVVDFEEWCYVDLDLVVEVFELCVCFVDYLFVDVLKFDCVGWMLFEEFFGESVGFGVKV